jgi:hypothetical protein
MPVPNPIVLRNMERHPWKHCMEDESVFTEVQRRLAVAGSRRELLYYTDVVDGIGFRLPSLSPSARTLDMENGMDRGLLGEFLGRASMESYREHGFMASALAVGRATDAPSEEFYKWMVEWKAIIRDTKEARLRFWSEQVRLAHDHFGGASLRASATS